MNELEFKTIIDYVCNKTPWKDNTNEDVIITKAKQAFDDMKKDYTKEKKLYRICGQTGSGKTSQMLYALEYYTSQVNKKPVILGVRNCASYHPNYNELLSKYGSSNIREKTNGFALKCMTYLLKLLIEEGYLILLDITLLDPIYEKYILYLLNKNNYSIEYHIMGVSNDISTEFIKKREIETGRKVASYSSEYFNYILDDGFNYLSNTDKVNSAFIWNAFDLNPVYVGKIKNAKEKFNYWRTAKKEFIYNEEELKIGKIHYLLNKKEG